MSSIILKYITNRILKDNQWNRLGVEDPYHELVPINVVNGVTKYKKVNRRLPDGISSNDLNVLEKFKKRAHRYDMMFSFFGVTFGWSNIVGIIPIFGTIVTTYWSLGLLQLARKLDDGFPLDIQILFLVNILIDFVFGLIPIVGDIIEIGYKSNSRNYLLLEKHLDRVGQKNLGIITKEEVKPGFINDKIQPYIDNTLKPNAKKAGDQFKAYLQKTNGHSKESSEGSSFQPSLNSSPSTHTSSTTVVTSATDSIDLGPRQRKGFEATEDDYELNIVEDATNNVSQHGIPTKNNPVFREDGVIKTLNSALAGQSERNGESGTNEVDTPRPDYGSLQNHNVIDNSYLQQ
ncbi:hypothetical protein G9P44_001615 [Scheffersomyces stipitis]|nr:hypothetical protein G9P44_001615 [Scheffersomyces stipitis]